VTAELDEMAAAAERQAAATAQAGQTPMTAKLASRSNALYAGVSLVLFQQITGQPSVLYYATSIFQAAGFAAESDATKVCSLVVLCLCGGGGVGCSCFPVPGACQLDG